MPGGGATSAVGPRHLCLVHAAPPGYTTSAPFITAERLFRSLEAQRLVLGSGIWQVAVYSIHDDEASRWVQVALVGREPHTLTLRLALTDDSARALQLITTWLSQPLHESEHVLAVS